MLFSVLNTPETREERPSLRRINLDLQNGTLWSRRWFLSALLGLCSLATLRASAEVPADAPVTALTGVRLIDGTGGKPLENATLVFQGQWISAVGSGPSRPALPPGARIVDASGQTIIPGLISAHCHLGLVKGASVASAENYTRDNVAHQLAQYEAYGVTAVMSLGVNRDALYDWREEQRQGKLPGAEIFTADRGLGVPGGVPPFPLPGEQVYRPPNPEAAREAVREMAARHPDLIKLWLDDNFGTMPKMPPEVFQAVISEAHAAVDEAHRQGLRVAAHLFYLEDAKALVAVGVDILAHSVRDHAVDKELIVKMKANKVAYIPTLALDESQYIYANHPDWMDSPFFTKAVAPDLLSTWLSPEYVAKTRASTTTARNVAAHRLAMRNVKTLQDAGILVAMGTDSGAMPTRVAGFAEHRELQLLVQAGLTPMEAIVCATANSAKVIGQESERGTLQPGKRADFLVLAANPLDDIQNTTRIAMVWHGGKQVVDVNGWILDAP